MPSSKDKFNKAIDESIKQGLEKRQNILSELVEDMQDQKNKPISSEERTISMENEKPSEQTEDPKTEKKEELTKQKKKETRLTGAASASWNTSENASWEKFSPSAKAENKNSFTDKTTEKSNRELDKSNNKEGNMKRIVSLLILVGVVALFLYYWSPWGKTGGLTTSMIMSNSSFSAGTPDNITNFAPQSEIFYKISQNQPFNTQTISLEIFKIQNNNETLFRKQIENNIDPQSKSFSYMLRPDFFKDPGEYKIKVFLGENKDRKLATQSTFTIKQ